MEEKINPVGSSRISFGCFPITIIIYPNTLEKQKQQLRERIKAHADSLYTAGHWKKPVSKEEIDQVMETAVINY